jgi:signal transduction histidine kinase
MLKPIVTPLKVEKWPGITPCGWLEHELRTPVAAIKAAAEILKNYPDLTDAERQAFTDVVVVESSRLTERVIELVDDCQDCAQAKRLS